MSDSHSRRFKEISEHLDRALELPLDQRFSFLLELRREDDDLASEVETLLARESEVGRGPGNSAVALALDSSWVGRRLGPYEILAPLGRGGMGEIYRGLDRRLGRQVAIKVLTSSTLLSAGARERFSREARAVAALDHPNVCTLHDIGTTEQGELYLVMAFYAGRTLKQRLAEGPLPVGEALTTAIAVADGLAHAHGAGIAHRDVKPANVMLTEDGGVKVLDFGIAKQQHEDDLTHTGQVLGTPAYMSPEQILGEVAGPATDVWALGVVLYEMLTGRRPFGVDRPSPRDVLEAAPPDFGDADVPPAVVSLVGRTLEKEPSRRFSSVAQLASGLRQARSELEARTASGEPGSGHRRRVRSTRWPAWAAVLVTLLGMAAWLASRPSPPPTMTSGLPAMGSNPGAERPNPSAPTLVVQPFENATGDVAVDPYAEGLGALLRDALSNSRHVRVFDSRRSPVAPGEDSATASVVGEIRPAGRGMVLTARLLWNASGEQLSGFRFEAMDPAELYGQIDALARTVRRALGLPTDEAVDVFAADFAAGHPDAYGHYRRGLDALADYRYGPAQDSFEDALDVTPGFTMARFRLAQVLAATGRTRAARDHLRTAVAESTVLGEREAGYIRATAALIDRRYGDAVLGFSRLVEAFPYEVDAHHLLALALRGDGRPAEAVPVLDVLHRIEPRAAVGWSLRGEILLSLGRPQEALEAFEAYLRLDPDGANGHHLVGDAYRAQGELEMAAVSYGRALERDPKFHFSTIQLATVEALAGRGDEALEVLDRLATDVAAAPNQRIDAALGAASILRAKGRFRGAIRRLEDMEALLDAEGVRAPLALTVRALCHLELGQVDVARGLADRAATEPPGRPFRYLFVRGLAELQAEDDRAFDATVARLLSFVGDATAGRAAAYLSGRSLLSEGRAGEAVAALRKAAGPSDADGYAYAVYGLGVAEALFAAGRTREAEAAARSAAQVGTRLDLLLDHRKAQLWLARIDAAAGRPESAARRAASLVDLWSTSDPEFGPAADAQRLTGPKPSSPGR